MTIDRWIADRDTDVFVIEDSDGNRIYDSRKNIYEPALYIMDSMITDIYTWHGVTVLAI